MNVHHNYQLLYPGTTELRTWIFPFFVIDEMPTQGINASKGM